MASIWGGELGDALVSARMAVACSERVGDSYFAPVAKLTLAAALHARGDVSAARTELAALEGRPGDELLDLLGSYGADLLTHIYLELGELDQAAQAAERAEARARRLGLTQLTATAACARAAVLYARGDPQAAGRIATEAAIVAEGAGNPLLTGRACSLAGVAAVSAGDRDTGLATLERAYALLSACGATREADRAAQQLRQLGQRVVHRPRVATGKTLAALSHREREVANHVAEGKTNREIAAILFLSEKTIESHLVRIYDKLGLRSRTELAAVVTRAPADGRGDRT